MNIYKKKPYLIIFDNSSPSIELPDTINVEYMFKCPLGDCVSHENNTYVGLPTLFKEVLLCALMILSP